MKETSKLKATYEARLLYVLHQGRWEERHFIGVFGSLEAACEVVGLTPGKLRQGYGLHEWLYNRDNDLIDDLDDNAIHITAATVNQVIHDPQRYNDTDGAPVQP